MSDVETQLVATLNADANFDADVAGRIYPLLLPANTTLPAVTYQRISGPRTHAIGSSSLLSRPRIQFTVWAATYAKAKEVSAQLRKALDGVLASMNDVSDPTAMWMAQCVNDADDYEPVTGRFRVTVDMMIVHDEV